MFYFSENLAKIKSVPRQKNVEFLKVEFFLANKGTISLSRVKQIVRIT